MQENLNINNDLTEKIAEKLACLEEKLFYRMINNIKSLEEEKSNEIKIVNNINLEEDKHDEIKMISKVRNLEENQHNKTKVENLNRKLREGRSLL